MELRALWLLIWNQCCVCWWSGAKVHSTIGRHGMVSIFVCWALPYTFCMIFTFTCAIGKACICAVYMGSDQPCICWWSGARLHSTNSRCNMEFILCILRSTMYIEYDLCFPLCWVCGLWSKLCLLMAWCQTSWYFCTGTLSFTIYVYYLGFHLCCVQGNDQCCVCSWTAAKLHSTISLHSIKIIFWM